MSFITIIHPDAARGRLEKIYSRIMGADGQVANVLQIHSLRPHSLEGHMALYRAVMNHPRNSQPLWFLETIGVYVSMLNKCTYCISHHQTALKMILAGEPDRYEKIISELRSIEPGISLTEAEIAALVYVKKLTEDPGSVTITDIERMRSTGMSDGDILEINQVAAYFAYANRTVLGLGVNIESKQSDSGTDNAGK